MEYYYRGIYLRWHLQVPVSVTTSQRKILSTPFRFYYNHRFTSGKHAIVLKSESLQMQWWFRHVLLATWLIFTNSLQSPSLWHPVSITLSWVEPEVERNESWNWCEIFGVIFLCACKYLRPQLNTEWRWELILLQNSTTFWDLKFSLEIFTQQWQNGSLWPLSLNYRSWLTLLNQSIKASKRDFTMNNALFRLYTKGTFIKYARRIRSNMIFGC